MITASRTVEDYDVKFGPQHTVKLNGRAEILGRRRTRSSSTRCTGRASRSSPLRSWPRRSRKTARSRPSAHLRASVLTWRAMASRVAAQERILSPSSCFAASEMPPELSHPTVPHHDIVYYSSTKPKPFSRPIPPCNGSTRSCFDMNGHPSRQALPARRSSRRCQERHDASGLDVFIMDPRGNCVEETGRSLGDGRPRCSVPYLFGTLRPCRSAPDTLRASRDRRPRADDPLDPRGVLARQVERFKAAGQTPVAAVELEFYVTVPQTNGAFTLETPHGLSDDPDIPMTFQFEDMDALRPSTTTSIASPRRRAFPSTRSRRNRPVAVRDQPQAQLRRGAGSSRRAAAEARRQGRRQGARAQRDLHGQAAPRLGGLRHAHPPEPARQGRQERFRRRSRSRRSSVMRSAAFGDHGRLHGHLGPVRQRLPPLRARGLCVRWPRTGASTTARSRYAFLDVRRPEPASNTALPAPTPIPIS